ncbi:MAG: HAMP domain-containing histidine kinase [Acidimicrobiia bacterium]|nr:HAMP domain-containing histidine kinase [Acidimicrobiia bacterium]
MWRGIRFRVTIVASIAMAVILILGGFALVVLQRDSLTATIDRALAQRADDLTALVPTGDDFGGVFPVGADEGFAQLLAGDGTVLASTPNLADAAPLPVDLPVSSDAVRTITGVGGDDDSFRVLTRPLEGARYLHVGTEFEVVAGAAETLLGLLAVTVPILILVTGTLIWLLVGRTLRPVERIRSEVAEIGSRELHRRVPQPTTGDEVERLAETMNEMLARLERSVERQQTFVADASHELRSPLTRIRSALELGQRGDGSHPGDDDALLRDVVGMQRLVEDLLFLARSDDGKAPSRRRRLDLDDLVIGEARTARADDSVSFDLSGVSAAHVEGDSVQLRSAVRNLLENARRHASGRVTVSLGEQDGEAVLTVTDDGPGIPESEAERVFERFTRLDDSRTTQTGGSGLGLAISRQIAESHGGSLRLTSFDTDGARFELRIPLAE